MIKIDAMGKACPKPLIETKNAIKALTSPDIIEVMVDNSMAVENIKGFANDNGFEFNSEKIADKQFKITINVKELKNDVVANENASCCSCQGTGAKNIVVAIGSDKMGDGDEKLGKNLMKAFIFSLTQAVDKPKTVLFFNSGANLTCEGSLSLEDLNNLQELDVNILTCGTCLDYYGLKDKLRVGKVTNMYDIVSTMENASLVIKP